MISYAFRPEETDEGREPEGEHEIEVELGQSTEICFRCHTLRCNAVLLLPLPVPKARDLNCQADYKYQVGEASSRLQTATSTSKKPSFSRPTPLPSVS